MKTSISFLKSNASRIDTIKKISETDANYIHVDIMDGKFVPNQTLSIEETNELLMNSSKLLDVHLMVENPIEYIEGLKNLNIHYLTIHIEIEKDIEFLLNKIHEYGMRAGLAINPETDISKLNPYLDRIDYILIMGVNPGLGGQELIKSTIDKIEDLRRLRETYNYHYVISFDGGVNFNTRSLLNNLDIIVSGSYVCMSDNYQNTINTLK